MQTKHSFIHRWFAAKVHLLILVGGMVTTTFLWAGDPSGVTRESHKGGGGGGGKNALPVEDIENAVGAQGNVDNGVLDIPIARNIGDVQGPVGVMLTPAFQIHGDLYFQMTSRGKAFLNGDIALLEPEVNGFVTALRSNNLVFQAFHQHMPTSPQVWFCHFRGVGDPVALATSISNAISVTATPLPQSPPSNPTTPLDANQLGSILHGDVSVGDEGVVTVTVERKDRIVINGVVVNPEAGISTTIEFKPLSDGSTEVVADFSMIGKEVNPVVDEMLLQQGWYQGCLYNQEIEEMPQLFFDHMVKVGDAIELATEIRNGLDLTKAR